MSHLDKDFEHVPGIYIVFHQHYHTDHYSSGYTVVKASSHQEAMDKVNAWVDTEPYGAYTPLPCKFLSDVHELTALR